MTYILQVLVGAFELLRKLAFPHFQGNFRLVQNSLLPACQRIATNDSTLDISYTFASHRQWKIFILPGTYYLRVFKFFIPKMHEHPQSEL